LPETRESYPDYFHSLTSPYAEPRDAFADVAWGLSGNWFFPPPLYVDSTKRGEALPIYTTEAQLKVIRDRNRRLVAENEFARCVVDTRIAFIVGTGFTYEAAAVGVGVDPRLLADVQRVIDTFAAANHLPAREAEAQRRLDRDGEYFLRLFPRPSGLLAVRFVEPEHVKAPAGEWTPARSFGVETDPRDVESVTGYWVVDCPTENTAPELVAADNIIHVRANVDWSAKRGLPLLYPVEPNLRRIEELLASMSTAAKARAKIAMIRRLDGPNRSAADKMAASLADGQTADPATGTATNIERLRFGTILTASKNLDYEFPDAGVNAADTVAVLQAELRAVAAAVMMPEFMLSADASNANYSSTLVAESPSVRNFERLQRIHADTFAQSAGSLLWRQIRECVTVGVLPAEALTQVRLHGVGPPLTVRDRDKEATMNAAYINAGVKSRRTVATELGLDFDEEARNIAAERAPAEPAPTTEVVDDAGHKHGADGKFSSSSGGSAAGPDDLPGGATIKPSEHGVGLYVPGKRKPILQAEDRESLLRMAARMTTPAHGDGLRGLIARHTADASKGKGADDNFRVGDKTVSRAELIKAQRDHLAQAEDSYGRPIPKVGDEVSKLAFVSARQRSGDAPPPRMVGTLEVEPDGLHVVAVKAIIGGTVRGVKVGDRAPYKADWRVASPTTEETVVGRDSLGRKYKAVDGNRVPPGDAEKPKAEKPDITKPVTDKAPSLAERQRLSLRAQVSSWLSRHDGPPGREARLEMYDGLIDGELEGSLGNHEGGASGKAARDLLMEAVGAALFGGKLTGGSGSPDDINVGHVYEKLEGQPRLLIDIKRYLWDSSGRARGHHGAKDLIDKLENLNDDCYAQVAIIPPGRGKPGKIVARFGVKSLSDTNGVVLAEGFSSIRDVLADPARYNDLKRRYEAFRDSLTPERWAQVREETQDTKADIAANLAKTLEGKAAAKVAAALPKESLLAATAESLGVSVEQLKAMRKKK
jgi:capsid protein